MHLGDFLLWRVHPEQVAYHPMEMGEACENFVYYCVCVFVFMWLSVSSQPPQMQNTYKMGKWACVCVLLFKNTIHHSLGENKWIFFSKVRIYHNNIVSVYHLICV